MSLRILLISDSSDEAALLTAELRKSGEEVLSECAPDAATMITALAHTTWDAVICNWQLEEFSALGALAVLKKREADLPFIVVSWVGGEENAAEAMRAGAHDFIVPSGFERLLPALERELHEHHSRNARRHAEAALRESEMRFRRLAESGVMGVVITSPMGHIVDANETFLQWLGFSHEDVVTGRLVWDQLIAPELQREHQAAQKQLDIYGAVRPAETVCIAKDGRRLPVMLGMATLPGGYLTVITDLSERKRSEDQLRRAEDQLRQSQKMEAIGSLAGGVAHDFNNLLSVILSYSQMLKLQLKQEDPMRADIEEIQSAGERAAGLTRQLLAFSRQQVLEPREFDINSTVMGLEKMLHRLIGEDIELRTVAHAGTPMIHADPGQIEQVIMNLVVNARDAMPRGGKLTIDTSLVELDAAYAAEHIDVVPGPHVMLAVSDTGMGMDKETQARIFEPFFTTKSRDQGTGLGLSTVFGIVKQSGGHIYVSSEVGAGTTMKIYFPRIEARIAEVIAAPAKDMKVLRGSETILLVEDEKPVRDLAGSILRRQGYHVLEAHNGGDALLICEQHNAKIDLLLTDVVMPRMSGRVLTERLQVVRPEMRVLYMSGYTDDAIVHHGVLDSNIAFLHKPLTPDSLARKVREVLELN